MPFHDNDHVYVVVWNNKDSSKPKLGVDFGLAPKSGSDIYWGNLEGESDWSESEFFTPPDKAQLYKQQESYFLDKEKISTAGSNGDFPTDIGKKVPTEEANLISSRISRISGGIGKDQHEYHRPAIDLDMECELVPSSSPGHYHLYIDKPMTWDQYQYLMYALQKVGIVQEGWVEASMERGQSMVRKPGVKKGVEAPTEERPHWGMQCNCPHCPTNDSITVDKEPF